MQGFLTIGNLFIFCNIGLKENVLSMLAMIHKELKNIDSLDTRCTSKLELQQKENLLRWFIRQPESSYSCCCSQQGYTKDQTELKHQQTTASSRCSGIGNKVTGIFYQDETKGLKNFAFSNFRQALTNLANKKKAKKYFLLRKIGLTSAILVSRRSVCFRDAWPFLNVGNKWIWTTIYRWTPKYFEICWEDQRLNQI